MLALLVCREDKPLLKNVGCVDLDIMWYSFVHTVKSEVVDSFFPLYCAFKFSKFLDEFLRSGTCNVVFVVSKRILRHEFLRPMSYYFPLIGEYDGEKVVIVKPYSRKKIVVSLYEFCEMVKRGE